MRLKTSLVGIVFLFILVLSGYAQQDDFPVLSGPYLGQKPPGTTPEIFATGTVSVDKFSEFVCIFTPRAEECIFDRYGDDEYQNNSQLSIHKSGCRKPGRFASV